MPNALRVTQVYIMKKIISPAWILLMAFPLIMPFCINAQIIDEEINSVDLAKPIQENRAVTLDADKKTIISSEVEVSALQNDQSVSDANGSILVDVSLFFKDSQNSEQEVQETIKNNIENEIEKALKVINEQSESSNITRELLMEKRAEIFETIDNYFQQDNNIESTPESVAKLNTLINDILIQIEEALQKEETNIEGEEFIFERVTLNETLFAYQDTLQKRGALFEKRNQQVYTDTDNDGLSDFDEIYIYKTDPNSAFTVEGKLNDKEKILAGIDPLSANEERIVYEDPRLDRDAVTAMTYMLLSIDFVPANESRDGDEVLTLRGTSLPNSLATIYIFSTPRVITVSTDEKGKWEYVLGNELQNGEHTVFVTTTDNKGRLLAKSDPTLFTKTSQTALVGVLVDSAPPEEVHALFSGLSFIILIGLLVIGMSVTFFLIVITRKEKEENSFSMPGSIDGESMKDHNQREVQATPVRTKDQSLYPHIDKRDTK